MTEFEFPIRKNLRAAWNLFTAHVWYFVLLSFVMFVLSASSEWHDSIIIKILATAATIVWSYVGISSMLAAVDGKVELLKFDALKLHLPTWRQALYLVGVIFGVGIITLGGLILLVIPGIYFMIKLLFSNFALVDRNGGVRQSMRFSWHMVRGDVFWTVLLCFVTSAAVMILGLLAFFVGIIVTYPIAMLFLALLYRALTNHRPVEAVVVQAQELSPAPADESAPAVAVQ